MNLKQENEYLKIQLKFAILNLENFTKLKKDYIEEQLQIIAKRKLKENKNYGIKNLCN